MEREERKSPAWTGCGERRSEGAEEGEEGEREGEEEEEEEKRGRKRRRKRWGRWRWPWQRGGCAFPAGCSFCRGERSAVA